MNLAANIEKSIPKHVLCIFNDICKHVHDRGSRAYLVGGVVRDLLLGYRNYDFDIVIEANAISLAKLIAKATEAVLTVHEQFKTARLDYADFYIDLATSRNEKYKHPGALPDIRQADLLTDLSRRDFTINAMAVSINTEDYGELIDPYHGLYDLNHQLIRILHNNSFVDDATRILRGLRYQQRFGFKFEKTTERLLRKNIDMLFTITGDRLRYELEQILKEDTHGSIIQQLYEYGILKEISLPVKEKTAINNYIEWTKSIDKESQWYEAYICLLTYSLEKEEIEKFIERLNFPSNIAAILVDTCDLKNKLDYLRDESLLNSKIYHILDKYNLIAIKSNFIACDNLTIRTNISLFLNKLRFINLECNGKDLKKLGIESGPVLGKILQMLHDAKINGEIANKLEELKLADSIKDEKLNR